MTVVFGAYVGYRTLREAAAESCGYWDVVSFLDFD